MDSCIQKIGGAGTSLGLAICKQLAELMGGEVGLESTPGQGSTFWFTVRCTPGDPQVAEAAAAETEACDAPPPDRALRILIAEDNQVNQAVLRAVLGKSGHDIDMVENGLEAVAAVMRGPDDLVLMVVRMPEMDGVTATRKIRELSGEAGKIPIIALTANAMIGDREKYLAAGMTDYVSKPINPQALFTVIAKHSGVTQNRRTPQKHGTADPHGATGVLRQTAAAGDKADIFAELMATSDGLAKET